MRAPADLIDLYETVPSSPDDEVKRQGRRRGIHVGCEGGYGGMSAIFLAPFRSVARAATAPARPRTAPVQGRLRRSVPAPASLDAPIQRSCACFGYGLAAISAMSLLRIACPNELKFSATMTKAPGPPTTLFR
jgi:hypothetical protein